MIPSLTAGALYLFLIIIVLRRRTSTLATQGWLLAYCGYSATLMVLQSLLLSDVVGSVSLSLVRGMLALGAMLGTVLTGSLTLVFLAHRSLTRVWLGVGTVWVGATLLAELSQAPPALDLPVQFYGILGGSSRLSVEILILGWLLLGLTLNVLLWRAYFVESLPLYANRILFWTLLLPLLLFGDALAAWPSTPWNVIGYGIHLLGTSGAVYGILSHRIPYLRGVVRWVISRSILTFLSGLLVLGGLAAIQFIAWPDFGQAGRWAIVAGIALVVAVLHQPLQHFFRWMLRRLLGRGAADPAEAVRYYSQHLSGIIDLHELASAAAKTLNELMLTRRSHLILATREDEQIALETLGATRGGDVHLSAVSVKSAIYQYFISRQRPLLQYDVDYAVEYAQVPEDEKNYFRSLGTDVYAPIVSGGQLIGLLALGPKSNRDPFTPMEMDLLAALANQTVGALENARLVKDLKVLNERIEALNEYLLATNERLEQLDAVKSDFIAIASHELRTPLAQIQGYADLLGQMLEQGTMDTAELGTITSSLINASKRMADVITAMADASQLDVDSMDLDFEQVDLSSILKQAVSPYEGAIHERNLSLIARGLSKLPMIYADKKRLVQVFENLITNAIKCTPDRGEIGLSGEVFEKDQEGQAISVRLSVADTGIGIDKDQLDLIFEKFYRTAPVIMHSTGLTKFKGAGPGLGLSLAKGIVEGHGGRIWAESAGCDEEKLPGSTFHVVLPVRPPAAEVRDRMLKFQTASETTAVSTRTRGDAPRIT